MGDTEPLQNTSNPLESETPSSDIPTETSASETPASETPASNTTSSEVTESEGINLLATTVVAILCVLLGLGIFFILKKKPFKK
jgi:uncharacterized membrane protein